MSRATDRRTVVVVEVVVVLLLDVLMVADGAGVAACSPASCPATPEQAATSRDVRPTVSTTGTRM
jgi:hypothetical protein